MLQAWEIRLERDKARNYFFAVISEAQKRGLVPAVDGLGPQGDLLAGTQRLSELPDTELKIPAAISSSRDRYASYLVDLLSSQSVQPFSQWLRGSSCP